MAGVVEDAAFFHYTLSAQQAFTLYAQLLTSYQSSARNGPTANLGAFSEPPVLGPVPAMVEPGIFKCFTDLVAHLKTLKSITETIGQNLHIEPERRSRFLASKPAKLVGQASRLSGTVLRREPWSAQNAAHPRGLVGTGGTTVQPCGPRSDFGIRVEGAPRNRRRTRPP